MKPVSIFKLELQMTELNTKTVETNVEDDQLRHSWYQLVPTRMTDEMIEAIINSPWYVECNTKVVNNVVTTINKEYRGQRYIIDAWNAALAAAPKVLASQSEGQQIEVALLQNRVRELESSLEAESVINLNISLELNSLRSKIMDSLTSKWTP